MLQTGSLKLSKRLFRSIFFLKKKPHLWSFWWLLSECSPKSPRQPCSPCSQQSWEGTELQLWTRWIYKEGNQMSRNREAKNILYCFAIRENKCLSYMDLGFVSSKGCREHNRVMFSSRWSRTSNHWSKYKFLQWKQKAKDIKVTAVFSVLIIWIENWCQLGIVQPFLGSSFTQRSNFAVGACGPYLLHLTDPYLKIYLIKNIF